MDLVTGPSIIDKTQPQKKAFWTALGIVNVALSHFMGFDTDKERIGLVSMLSG